MVAIRKPERLNQPLPPNSTPTNVPSHRSSFATTALTCSVAFAAGAGIAAISQNPNNNNPFLHNALNFLLSNFSPNNNNNGPTSSPIWGSLSLSGNSPPVIESKTGVSFPSVLKDSQRLLGVGLRKRRVMGLKNIDVYAFGVYADDSHIKKFLSEKYRSMSISELKENKEMVEDLIESDICMTVRLQIVYGRLSIRSVRNAFEESVGKRLQRFGGADNKELLQRFASHFKYEYKIPRGFVIELSRDQGHILRTTIDGKDAGSIESKLLCRSILDLYIGDDPFDRKAKENIELNLANSLLDKQ
ncbi:hypothetical protein LguiA_020393 [Lonicera macranthoides]